MPLGNRYFRRCMKSIYALIAGGLDAVRIAFSKSKIKMSNSSTKTPWHLRFAPRAALNLKEMAATAGIGTIYGLLIVGIFLMPVFWMRASVRPGVPPCSWTHYVQVNGYSGNVFGGVVCYEQYYDLMKCLKQVDTTYRADLVKANSRRSTCAMLCTLAGLGGGLGCFGLGMFTSGLGAAPCYYKVGGGMALCYAACRADFAANRSDAKTDADAALQSCFTAHEATPVQLGEPDPYAMPGSGLEHRRPCPPDNGAIVHDDRMWRAN